MNYFFLTFFISSVIFIFTLTVYVHENSKYRIIISRGLYDPKCPADKTKFFKKRISDNWNGERTLYPKKYIALFERDSRALEDFQLCLLWDLQHRNGYLPDYIPSDYNRNNYNPYLYFTDKHNYKIKYKVMEA